MRKSSKRNATSAIVSNEPTVSNEPETIVSPEPGTDVIGTGDNPLPSASEPTTALATAEPVPTVRQLFRDAASIAAYRTNYGSESNRDASYAAFFYLAGAATGEFTLRQAYDAGRVVAGKRFNPLYSGSAKATDVGAVNRLRKAGYINPTNADCTAFAFTERGTHFARSTIAKMLPDEPAGTDSNG